jgi:peptidoglycan/xylan/chitin deacetylase (PgdA/CDA1 family)
MIDPAMTPRPALNLNFHGIGTPKERDFGEGERGFWATIETFEAVLDAAAARDNVTISFDDGNTTDIQIALPALLERGITATFFIVPGWLATPGFLTAADVQELAASGMTIGNHGLQHRVWTELDQNSLDNEVRSARIELEHLTKGPIDTLAIPYGRYNDAVLATLQSHGYAHVFTSDGGRTDRAAWLQPREHLRADHTQADLRRLLSGL